MFTFYFQFLVFFFFFPLHSLIFFVTTRRRFKSCKHGGAGHLGHLLAVGLGGGMQWWDGSQPESQKSRWIHGFGQLELGLLLDIKPYQIHDPDTYGPWHELCDLYIHAMTFPSHFKISFPESFQRPTNSGISRAEPTEVCLALGGVLFIFRRRGMGNSHRWGMNDASVNIQFDVYVNVRRATIMTW